MYRHVYTTHITFIYIIEFLHKNYLLSPIISTPKRGLYLLLSGHIPACSWRYFCLLSQQSILQIGERGGVHLPQSRWTSCLIYGFFSSFFHLLFFYIFHHFSTQFIPYNLFYFLSAISDFQNHLKRNNDNNKISHLILW